MEIAKAVGGPGSLGFFVAAIGASVAAGFLWPGRRYLAWLAASTTIGAYVVLSLPIVSRTLADNLLPAEVAPLSYDRRVETLVVLGGDNAAGRVARASDAYRRLSPARVLVLADDWFARNLVHAGIPRHLMTSYSSARTTRAQIDQVSKTLHLTGATRAAIVASRLHVPRVTGLLHRYGLDGAMLIAAPLDHDPAATGADRFIPSYAALLVSRDALYEHLALVYYQWRGWI